MEKQQIHDIVNVLRGNMRQDDMQTLRDAFRALHRTEKQNVIRNIAQIIDEAAADHQDGLTDARNEASAKWAFEAMEIVHYFPYI